MSQIDLIRPPHNPEPAVADNRDPALGEILATLYRRKWVVIQAFLVVTIIGLIIAFVTKPIYRTTAKLLVASNQRIIIMAPADGNGALAPRTSARQLASIDTQLSILRGTDFRSHIAQKLPTEQASAGVDLSYGKEEETELILISGESTNPEAAAAWVNAAAAEFVRQTDAQNRKDIESTEKFLLDAQQRARQALARAENKLRNFKIRTQYVDSEEERSVRLKEGLALEAALRQSRADIAGLSAQIAGLRSWLAHEPEELVRAVSQPNPERDVATRQLASVRAERAVALASYKEDSPQIQHFDQQIRQLEAALKDIPAAITTQQKTPNPEHARVVSQIRELETQRAAAVMRNQQLSAAPGEHVSALSDIATGEVELAQIQRDREIAEKNYRQYSDTLMKVQQQERSIPSTVELTQSAIVPRVPVRPDKIKQVAMAMLLGLALGGAFAFVQEYLDDRIASGEDVERLTGLVSLGSVPTIPEGVDRLLVGHDALSPLTESYRLLRTSVLYASVDHPLRTLIVTSPQQGEGKSVTSANLAIAMALQNKRVILMDADLRRPKQHRLFNMSSEDGLTKVLSGEMTLDEALKPTAIEGLQILTCGPLPPNPPELLNSQAMLDLMEQLRERSDLILIDTPPILPVTDSQVVAGYVDGVVLVIEVGELRKASLRAAYDLLSRTRARIVGTVLNKVDQGSKYYRKGYYRGGYTYGGYTYGGYTAAGYGPGSSGLTLGGEAHPAPEPETPEATAAPRQLPPPSDWD